MERAWYIEDESHERPGFICLAIRETESGRLIADMSDYPDDVSGFVERVKEEANIIAHSRELRDMLARMLYAAETQGESKQEDGEQHQKIVDEAHALLEKAKGK